MESIFRKKYMVQVSDIDFRRQLKLSSLFVYLQDMATEHAYNIGVGRDALQEKYGIIWVLNRAVVEIIRHPVFKEEITIETWPEQPDKVQFNRNFLVYDKGGNVIARAFSQWVVIDYQTRKLRRSSIIEEKFPKVDRERPITGILNKIKPIGGLNLSYKKTVGYSDIDINEHLNNAKYIDYIMDCFSLKLHKKYNISSIQIDYLHEALPGEIIQLYTDTAGLKDNFVYIEGINENTSSTIFKAQITIE
ncbi:MAG: acyl-ACP thioesterase [Tissierellia bacterium]|nr:acyl-ACP thioesterase [Tissierellia bacterium]